jgi:uncharacterized membrane protein (DUF373 family)
VNEEHAPHPVVLKIESIILYTLQAALLASVILATIFGCYLFLTRIYVHPNGVRDIDLLHVILQNVFGGVLIVYLGLELLETLRLHFQKREERLKAIITVATIAVARQAIVIDPTETPSPVLFGLAALLLSLAVALFFVKRSVSAEDERAQTTNPK